MPSTIIRAVRALLTIDIDMFHRRFLVYDGCFPAAMTVFVHSEHSLTPAALFVPTHLRPVDGHCSDRPLRRDSDLPPNDTGPTIYPTIRVPFRPTRLPTDSTHSLITVDDYLGISTLRTRFAVVPKNYADKVYRLPLPNPL